MATRKKTVHRKTDKGRVNKKKAPASLKQSFKRGKTKGTTVNKKKSTGKAAPRSSGRSKVTVSINGKVVHHEA